MECTEAASAPCRLLSRFFRAGVHHRAAGGGTHRRAVNSHKSSEQGTQHTARPCDTGHPARSALKIIDPVSVRHIVRRSGGDDYGTGLPGQPDCILDSFRTVKTG